MSVSRVPSPAALGALLALIAPLAVTAAGGGPPQQRSPPIRVAVDYVHVDVAVVDQRGAFVRDLTADDFEIDEDGARQTISSVALVEAPPPASAPAAAASLPEPDVTSNDVEDGGRTYVLVLDDLHVDPLRSTLVKNAARRFVERYLGPRDVAAVIHTSGRADAGQDFTSRQSLLLAAVEKFSGRKLRSRVLEALEEYQRRSDRNSADPRLDRATDPRDAERADQAQRTLDTVTNLADALARVPGRRKTLLLFSEGIEYPLTEGAGQTSTGLTAFTSSRAPVVRRGLQDAVGAAARANITIYGIDPRGLASAGAETIEVSAFPQNPQLGLSPDAFQEELRDAQASLQSLSEQTGGVAAVSSNDLDAALARVVRDSGTYYMLGYRSTSRRADGRFHRIAVRVKRPGVHVRSRAGYAARADKSEIGPLEPSAEPSAVLRGALNAPLPLNSVPVRMFAVPVRGLTQASVAVGLEIGAHGFRFSREDQLYVDKVDVALVALDARSAFKTGDRQTVQLRLKPETYTAVQAQGLRVFFRLELPPGRYQLRAAVNDAGSGVTGTAFYDVDVPDFHNAPLALSGLAIAASSSAAIPTPLPDPVFAGSLPFPPTAARTFDPGETLMVLFEVYRQPAMLKSPVDLTTSVRDAAGRVVFRTQDRMEEPAVGLGRPDSAYTARVPLDRLAPGDYVLRVEARTATSPDAAVRQVPFRVGAPKG